MVGEKEKKRASKLEMAPLSKKARGLESLVIGSSRGDEPPQEKGRPKCNALGIDAVLTLVPSAPTKVATRRT